MDWKRSPVKASASLRTLTNVPTTRLTRSISPIWSSEILSPGLKFSTRSRSTKHLPSECFKSEMSAADSTSKVEKFISSFFRVVILENLIARSPATSNRTSPISLNFLAIASISRPMLVKSRCCCPDRPESINSAKFLQNMSKALGSNGTPSWFVGDTEIRIRWSSNCGKGSNSYPPKAWSRIRAADAVRSIRPHWPGSIETS